MKYKTGDRLVIVPEGINVVVINVYNFGTPYNDVYVLRSDDGALHARYAMHLEPPRGPW